MSSVSLLVELLVSVAAVGAGLGLRARDRMSVRHLGLLVVGAALLLVSALLEAASGVVGRHQWAMSGLLAVCGCGLGAWGMVAHLQTRGRSRAAETAARLRVVRELPELLMAQETPAQGLREAALALQRGLGGEAVSVCLVDPDGTRDGWRASADGQVERTDGQGMAPCDPRGLVVPVRLAGEVVAELGASHQSDAATLEWAAGTIAAFIEHTRRRETWRQQTEFWRSAVCGSPTGMIVLDAEGRFVEYNRTMERITGYAPQEVPNERAWLEAVAPEPAHRAILEAGWRQVVYGRADRTFEILLLHRDATERRVVLRAHTLSDDGSPAHTVVAVEDITERDQALRALAASQQLHRTLVEQVPSGICVVHPDTGEIAFVNQAASTMLGYSEGEIETRQVLDVVAPGHRETLMSRIAEWVQGRGADDPVRYTLLRKDGSRVQTEISSALITWRGRPAILAVVTDITQRLHAEAALDFQREIISTALRYAPVGVTVVTADHTIVLWNDCQVAMYGVSAVEAEGARLGSVLAAPAAGPVLQRVDEVLQRGVPSFDPDYELVGHDGSRRTINLAVYPLKGARGQMVGAALLAQDVTEQRAGEERLRQAAKMEALGQLAGGVAHDFRNLLTAMLGNLSLARASAHGEIAPLLHDAEQAAQRAVAIVGQLLAFSRKTPTRMAITDVNAIAAEAVGLMRSTLDRRIEVEVRPEAELALVQGDGNQLHQVIVNLMINARDAVMTRIGAENAAGTYRITVATRHANLDSAAARTRGGIGPGRYVVLAVQDTGCGMDQETRQHLFEPFFTTKAEGQGTGLGMATVYSIVRQHRGWIDLASREGNGTTIEIYLPEAAAAEPEAVASGVPEVQSGRETVLLVDDEAMIRDLGRRALERAGYEVVTAGDGREALQVLSERPDEVDLMILDMSMPGLSGHDVLAKLREERSALKVIIASGEPRQCGTSEAKKAGVCGFLPKPFRLSDLTDGVRGALDGRLVGGGRGRSAGWAAGRSGGRRIASLVPLRERVGRAPLAFDNSRPQVIIPRDTAPETPDALGA